MVNEERVQRIIEDALLKSYVKPEPVIDGMRNIDAVSGRSVLCEALYQAILRDNVTAEEYNLLPSNTTRKMLENYAGDNFQFPQLMTRGEVVVALVQLYQLCGVSVGNGKAYESLVDEQLPTSIDSLYSVSGVLDFLREESMGVLEMDAPTPDLNQTLPERLKN